MAFCHSDGLCQHYKWASEQTPLKREDISIMEREREICVKHLTQHNIAYNENSLERATHYYASVSDLQLSKRPFLGMQISQVVAYLDSGFMASAVYQNEIL